MTSDGPASFIGTLRMYLADESLYMARPPIPAHPGVGRPRKNPYWLWMLYNQLITIHRSIRAVERELATPEVWHIIQTEARLRFPSDPAMWPTAPMKRHEFAYLLGLIAATSDNLNQLRSDSEIPACEMALEAGLLTGHQGSVNFPGKSDCLHSDGVVIRRLYGPVDTDPASDAVPRRTDPDSKGHTTGGGKRVYGTKFNKLIARGDAPGSRFILSVDHVADGNEVKTSLEMLARTLPRVPNAAAFIYDGALRGVHHNQILTTLGLAPLSPMYPASGAKNSGDTRVEKRVLIETPPIKGGRLTSCRIVAEGGAAGILVIDAGGNEFFQALQQLRVYKRQNENGSWRWYADYQLPVSHGGGTVSMPHYNTPEDRKRKFNRTENLRLFPKGSKQYDTLYGRRSDAESSNMNLKNSLWIDRAHCLGAKRQLVMLHGYQRAVNAVAIAKHRASTQSLPSLAA